MASCLAALHVWTLKSQTVIADTEVGVFTYHEKNEESGSDHPYLAEKTAYTESRDVTWTPKNKRPDKIKDSLKEAEELMSQSRCLTCQWLNREHFVLVLASGILISYKMSSHTGDVDKIFIDKSLVGKITSDNPSDVLLTDNYMVFCYPDKTKLDYIYFMKKPESSKKMEKITAYDPRISQVDLVGPMTRRLDRKLNCSLHEDIVLVWWPTSGSEAWPWSPMTSDKERANLVLYTVNGLKLELIAYTRTDCDPVGIQYSLVNYHQIFSVEQSHSTGGDINAVLSIYECSRSRITKYSSSTVHVTSALSCFGRNPSEDKVIIACEDGLVILYDEYRKSTHHFTTNMKPNYIRWHPSGVLAFISSARGEIQVFDMALSPMLIQLVSEQQSPMKSLDMAKYFSSQPKVSDLEWNPCLDETGYILPECRDSMAILCDRGPVVMLQLYLGVMTQGHVSALALVNQYVKYRQLDEAIGVLSSLNWNLDGQTCYACVTTIVNHLLRNTLNAKLEEQLESALGTFYAPVRPMSEVTVLEYRDSMSRLARRFFHQLLRYTRFEKAFLLAVDIGARDLFMDIHYLATDKGELALAEVAKRKADEIEAEALAIDPMYDEDDDDMLRRSDDNSDDTYSSDEEYYCDVTPPSIPPRAAPRVAVVTASRVAPPPPPEFAYPPLDARFQVSMGQLPPHSPGLVGVAEAMVEQAESRLTSKSHNEYTCTLLDEPILPPPASHADSNPQHTHDHERKDSNIKVIHFGIV